MSVISVLVQMGSVLFLFKSENVDWHSQPLCPCFRSPCTLLVGRSRLPPSLGTEHPYSLSLLHGACLCNRDPDLACLKPEQVFSSDQTPLHTLRTAAVH